MKLMDKIDFKDHIKGIVTIYKDGEILLKGHNTIVNTGRQFVKDIFERSAFIDSPEKEDSSDVSTYEDYKFYKAYFGKTGSNNAITTDFMELKDIKIDGNEGQDPSYIDSFTKTLYNDSDLSKTAVIKSNVAERYFSIIMELSGSADKSESISEIFLTIARHEGETFNTADECLFSRFVFDPVYLGAGSNYRIEYYICF